ncbi:MAG: roadblock/LC7 domain-containing protein [Promethearchaeota archaeon]
MDILKQVKAHLDTIKSIRGVENAVLTQRDGNPILSSGVWLSKDEIFNVSAATSAIYNVGLSLHGPWLKYMVIEGPKAKIMIAPISSNNLIKNQNELTSEYFIALTTLSKVNLGSVFIKTQSTLTNIYNLIQSSGLSFKPPLREYNKKQIEQILNNFKKKASVEDEIVVSSLFISLPQSVFERCEEILSNFNKTIPNLIYSSIACRGGYIVTNIQPSDNFNLTPDAECAMSFSLYDTASRYAWLLKKMNINSIFLDCNHYLHFIMGFHSGIFSSYLLKAEQRIGLIRLIVPKFLILIQDLLEQAKQMSFSMKSIPETMISPLMIK